MAGLVAALIPISFAALMKFFPDRNVKIPTEKEFSNSEMAKWALISLFIFFGIAGFLGYSVWQITLFTYKLLHSRNESLILIGMPDTAFALPAFFSSMAISYPLLEAILKRLLKDRYALFSGASMRQHGSVASNAAMKVLSFIAIVFFLLGNLYFFQWKMVFYPTYFEDCGLLSCSKHLYSQVSEVGIAEKFIAPNGSIARNQNLYLQFQDGRVWSPYILRGHCQIENVANLVSEKAKIIVKKIEYLPENK